MGSRQSSSSKTTSNSHSAGGNMDQAMQKLPPVSSKDSNTLYTGMLGGQLNAISEMFGPLIQGGQQAMQSNPGLTNFLQNTGQKVQQMEPPQWLSNFSEAARALGQQGNPQAGQPPPAGQAQPDYLSRMSPEQQERFANWRRHQAQYGRR